MSSIVLEEHDRVLRRRKSRPTTIGGETPVSTFFVTVGGSSAQGTLDIAGIPPLLFNITSGQDQSVSTPWIVSRQPYFV